MYLNCFSAGVSLEPYKWCKKVEEDDEKKEAEQRVGTISTWLGAKEAGVDTSSSSTTSSSGSSGTTAPKNEHLPGKKYEVWGKLMDVQIAERERRENLVWSTQAAWVLGQGAIWKYTLSPSRPEYWNPKAAFLLTLGLGVSSIQLIRRMNFLGNDSARIIQELGMAASGSLEAMAPFPFLGNQKLAEKAPCDLARFSSTYWWCWLISIATAGTMACTLPAFRKKFPALCKKRLKSVVGRL